MKIQLYWLMTILLLSSKFSNAQSSKEQHPKSYNQLSGLTDQQKLKELVSRHSGTYQFRVTKEDYIPIQSLTILDTVVNNRQLETSLSFQLDEYTWLFIPSYSIIESETFDPLDPVVYITTPQDSESNK